MTHEVATFAANVVNEASWADLVVAVLGAVVGWLSRTYLGPRA